MDYILPDSDTMAEMAKEYAKIKRVGTPPVDVLSADPDPNAVPAPAPDPAPSPAPQREKQNALCTLLFMLLILSFFLR